MKNAHRGKRSESGALNCKLLDYEARTNKSERGPGGEDSVAGKHLHAIASLREHAIEPAPRSRNALEERPSARYR